MTVAENRTNNQAKKKEIKVNFLKKSLGVCINDVTQLGGGGGGGQPLCYAMMNMVSEMVKNVLRRGGGGQIMVKIASHN